MQRHVKSDYLRIKFDCRDNGAEDEDSRPDLEHDEDGNDVQYACGDATDAICNLEVEHLPLCSVDCSQVNYRNTTN
jgi:hypothetical protein